jgi:multidrug efflux pump subunit AcrA (membrane-fusion protein)
LNRAEIPAREAGVVAELAVREGESVEAGALLVRLDPDQAALEAELARDEWERAKAEAESDVAVKLAEAGREVAAAEVDAAVESNRIFAGAVPPAELRRLRLALIESGLEGEQARRDRELAAMTASAHRTRAKLAELRVKYCEVTSPLAGIVVEITKQPGEWVGPGEPVCRVVRLDRLAVEGHLDASHFTTADVLGRSVRVQVEQPNGKTISVEGTLVYAGPEVDPVTGQFPVRAEVENPDFTLRPGVPAQMTISLDDTPSDVARR